MYLTDNERALQIRSVAWIPAPAGDDSGRRLTTSHYVRGTEDGSVLEGARTLCGRTLPDEWDIASGRFQTYGDGLCRRCLNRFEARVARRTA